MVEALEGWIGLKFINIVRSDIELMPICLVAGKGSAESDCELWTVVRTQQCVIV